MFPNQKGTLIFKILGLRSCMILVLILLLSGLSSSVSGAETWSYVSSKKCKKCHLKQYKSWEQTEMAKAFEILKPGIRTEAKEKAGLDPNSDYTKDEKCLSCHTTGYGKPGGFISEEETPDLVGVGCEVCHGPGEGYLRDGYMTMRNKEFKRKDLIAVGFVIPQATTCTDQCHNDKNPFFDADEPFDWEKRKQEGTHEHISLKFNHE